MSQFINNPEHTFGFDTLQLHVGQESADPASDSRAVPIYQTTSYVFRNSQHAADRFGLADAGNIYGRLTNSTQGVFEDRIAALEGGVAGLAVASGAAAITYTLQALAQAGDHVVAQKTIYGGSYNLLEHTLSQFGVETTFVDAHNLDEVEGAIKDNTTVIYLETLGNPNSDIPNIDAISEIAKKHGLPVVVGVEQRGFIDLIETGDAACGTRLFPRLIQCGQQHRGEDRNNGNHDQQFDKGKFSSLHDSVTFPVWDSPERMSFLREIARRSAPRRVERADSGAAS